MIDISKSDDLLKEQYYTLLKMLPASILITRNGILEAINEAGVKMYGYDSEQELIGRNMFDFFAETREDLGKRVETLYQKRQAVPFVEQKVFKKDGKIITIEVCSAPLSNGSILNIIHDISLRKEREKVLEDFNIKLLQQVDDIIKLTHELRRIKHAHLDILQTIMMYLDSDDYTNLKNFFSVLMNKNDELYKDNSIFLILLLDRQIREIVSKKIEDAYQKNIRVSLLIKDSIDFSNFDIEQLCKVINKVFDCYIKKAVDTEQKEFTFGITKTDNKVVLYFETDTEHVTCRKKCLECDNIDIELFRNDTKYVHKIMIR